MEQIKTFFEACQQIGMQDEQVLLAIVGALLAWFVWRQNKIFKVYHQLISTSITAINVAIQTMSKSIVDINDYQKKIDDHLIYQDRMVNAQYTQNEIQRETVKEKLDGLEDHIKEVKKHLIFGK